MGKGHNKVLNYVKLLIALSIVLFVYFKLEQQEYSFYVLVEETTSIINKYPYLFCLVFFLMPINLAIESLKWRYIARKVVVINLHQSFQGVLAGLSLSFITPHGLGDYVGRITLLESDQRAKLTGGILLGRLCQMAVTLFFGLFGISQFVSLQWALILTVALLLSVVLLLRVSKSILILIKHNISTKVSYYIEVLSEYRLRDVLNIFGLSLARYLVFCLQLVILLSIFNNNLSWYESFKGATWIFLSKSVVPTFNFLSDLGVREFSAIYFFESYPVELPMIVIATLLLWTINILIPTILGIPLVFKMKFKSV